MPARRLLLFAALLLAVGALAAVLTPRDLRRPGSATQRTATLPRAGPGQLHRATVSRTLRAGSRRGRVVGARVGDRVLLTVEARTPDEVAIGEDRFASVDPFSPARFDFIAERPGTFPIRLREAGQDLGRLVVQPR